MITEQYTSAPEVFAWKPTDIALPAVLTFVPSVLVAFARQTGAMIYPWYHDLPIWQVRRTVSKDEQAFRGIQVGFGGMGDWPLPGSEGLDGIRLTLAGWVEPREEPGALATHILRGSAIRPDAVLSSLWHIWEITGGEDARKVFSSAAEAALRNCLGSSEEFASITVRSSGGIVAAFVELKAGMDENRRSVASEHVYECATEIQEFFPSTIAGFHVLDPDMYGPDLLDSLTPVSDN